MSCHYRHSISDKLWAKIEPLCDGTADKPGQTGANNRLFINAVLYVIREGISWRKEFGAWNSVYQRFRRWQKRGTWEKMLNELVQHSECNSLMIDSTFIKNHLSAAGAKGGNQAIGRSKGGSQQRCIWPWMRLVCLSDSLLQMVSLRTVE